MKKGTKKSGSNKSQAIRDYARENPTLGPTQIANDLVAMGIEAYPALVSQALRGMEGRTPGTRKKGRPAKSSTQKGNTKGRNSRESAPANDYVAILKFTADFVKQCGGVEQAADALKAFQKVTSIIQN